MINWLGEFGASLASYALTALWFFGSIWIAHKITTWLPTRWQKTDRQGCLLLGAIALIIGAILLPVFGPAIHILESYACRSADDYEMCMDPPSDY